MYEIPRESGFGIFVRTGALCWRDGRSGESIRVSLREQKDVRSEFTRLSFRRVGFRNTDFCIRKRLESLECVRGKVPRRRLANEALVLWRRARAAR